ncbi:MAG: deoxyguanosinetriphosphate triphosphohydrolase [Nitrospinae bacterium]|nr:deoxyguanosinetriphosphate triphosphohydrolase [Nitrospinota bacterium]
MRGGASRGRRHPEDEHPYRSPYMRDRDRVIHTQAFRRLEFKTQVFVYHEGDHFRTRLTHSIEVAQIARTMARTLRLNEDLIEAIALSHDLGHPPFGHSGESVLAEKMADDGGFEHNVHGLRIVDHVENRYPDFRGVNLTWETREAIAKHSKMKDHASFAEFHEFPHPSLEAQVADCADSIAYGAHDLDDGLTSGLLNQDDLNEVSLWRRFSESLDRGVSPKLRQSFVVRSVINAQASDLIATTQGNIARLKIAAPDDARRAEEPVAAFSPAMKEERRELKTFLMANMYKSHRVVRMESKTTRVVRELFDAYLAEPKLLPPPVRKNMEEVGKRRIVCDYIAGMTDKYALEEHQKLFDPLSRV